MSRKFVKFLVVLTLFCYGFVFYISLSLYNTFSKGDGAVKHAAKQVVHIVGKAAISDYLWQHILEGQVLSRHNGFFRTGSLETPDVTFRFLSGPGYIQTTIPQDIEYMVIVLNGRSEDKRRSAVAWLEYMTEMKKLLKVGVVLLGDENCQNDWILPHLDVNSGGVVNFLFVVYDWGLVNNKNIFQWPLGVATYRGFPLIENPNIDRHRRRWTCNFMGTVYPNSSRSELLEITSDKHFSHSCVSIVRNEWVDSETPHSLSRYIDVLNNSDYTLCPVGKNTECYRIYEALSLGSIPVVEDVMTDGKCVSPLRLFKEHDAPVVYVKNWANLNITLYNMKGRTSSKFCNACIVKWYKTFKYKMKDLFVRVVKRFVVPPI